MASHKIMVVDDDPDFRQLLEFDLIKQGYNVISAGDGEEGLNKAKTEKPALILLDIKMPQMDGYTFVRHLRKDTDTTHIPVVVLTSYEPMKDMFKLEGVEHYFVKSADTEGLFATIKANLKEK